MGLQSGHGVFIGSHAFTWDASQSCSCRLCPAKEIAVMAQWCLCDGCKRQKCVQAPCRQCNELHGVIVSMQTI